LATASHADIATLSILFQHVAFFALGGSNSIASVDLSNAYNGVSGYNVIVVGVLTFVGNWAGPVWWASATHLLLLQKLRADCASSAVVAEDADQNSAVASGAQLRRGREQLTRALTKTKVREEDGKEEQDGNEKGKRTAREENEKRRVDERSSARSIATATTVTVVVDAITRQVALHSAFTCVSLVFVMAACTALRAHLFIWSVFSPKYLYAIAWSVGQHLLVNVVCGALVPLLFLLVLPRLRLRFHSSSLLSVK
jgi:ethanolaminephosphotransferase